jgi:DUF971 family protein
MTAAPAYPVELVLSADRRTLAVAWDDGAADRFDAAHLRAACRCAQCRRAAVDGRVAAPDPALTIATLHLIGDGAVNIAFADRHARGIYPWTYLRRLGADASASALQGPTTP